MSRTIPISKVVHVDLDEGLRPIAVEPRYSTVHLVVRWQGQVVGQVVVPKLAVVPVEVQRAAIVRQLGDTLWHVELERLLDEALGAPREAPPIPISVVVCTRDRVADLERCLARLAELDPAPAEVIVVDSASRAPHAVRAACARAGVRYAYESVPGAARARNRGVIEARGAAIAFTDDDCEPEPGWLRRVAVELADPRVAAITGVVVPVELETPAQWLFEVHGGFRRGFRRLAADGAQVDPAMTAGVLGVSANLVVRRAALERTGLFAEHLGPGTHARAGEDYELLARVLAAGDKVVFDPGQVVGHRHRRDLPALRGTLSGYGISSVAFATDRALTARDPGAFRILGWWWGRHLPSDLRDVLLRRTTRLPLVHVLAEAAGTLAGPAALWRSRRQARATEPLTLPSTVPELSHPGQGNALAVVAEPPPGLSVVVPTSGRPASLAALLRALDAQRYPPERVEVVVVLDGPSVDSRAAVEGAATRMRTTVREIDRSGVAAARNAGVEAAGESLVVFLDDDVLPDPGCLAAHAAAHAEGGEQVVLGYAPPVVGAGFWGVQLRAWWEDHFARKGRPGYDLRWSDVVTLDSSFPRALLLRERFDPIFGGRHEDWELGVRLVEQGVRLAYVPEARAEHALDASFVGAVVRQRLEAHADVALALRHPRVAGELPLAAALERPDESGAVTDRRLAHVARLEHLGLRGPWRRAALALLGDAYVEGLREAVPDAEELRSLRELVRAHPPVAVDLRLGEAAPPSLPRFGAIELVVHVGERVVARVPGAPTGSPWDAAVAVGRVRRQASREIRAAVTAERLSRTGLDAAEVVDGAA